jgi:N-acylglucosamine 2-epimerase
MTSIAKKYADFYRNHLLNDIMPFWENRCIDNECGGYITCFDREGNITDKNKYIWFQGRQLYTFSLLYNKIERKPKWLEMAEWGYKFLVEKAYAGNGRWNFELDRAGNVIIGTNSIYSDFHVVQGLAEYMLATDCKNLDGMRILTETYDAIERNVNDPSFKDLYENTWSQKYIWHDLYLTALNAASIVSQVLPEGRTTEFEDNCLEKILYSFARDEYKMVFEAITRDGGIDLEPEGRFINPGHSLESMWFCMETAARRKNDKDIKRALDIVEWTYNIGYDKQYGGIFSYLDATGQEPVPLDWYRETNSLWDDKVWWVNCESLCSFATAYVLSKDEKYLKMFEDQHEYCQKHFFDPQYGEWYERLHRDGSIKVSDKGTKWKCAFHLTRSIVKIISMFESI